MVAPATKTVRIGIVGLTCALLAASALPAASPAPDPVWQKAVAMAARTAEAKVHPGKMEMRSCVKKPDGTVEDQSVILFRVWREGDESRTEVISATENGKDVTAKVKAEEEKERKGSADKKKEEGASIELEPGYHPFGAEAQARVTWKRSGEELLAGRPAVVFRFKHSGKDGRGSVVGRAWIDPESGVPLRVEASPDPLPKHVSLMRTTVKFEIDRSGLWLPTTTDIHGEGGMLWIKRSFDSSVTFLEWYREAEGATPSRAAAPGGE